MSLKDVVLPKAEVIDACKKGDYSKVAFFLSGKRGKKTRTPLNFFRSSHDSHWLVEYKDEKTHYTLLHYSAYEGQNEVSKLLMDYEPLLVLSKTTKNILPIHLAAWNGHLEIVKMLLLMPQEKPVNIINAVNLFKETPLHLAVQRGHINVIQYLLRKGADPFIRNESKENVLDTAARIGVAEAIRLLCQTWPNFPVQSAYESLKNELADVKKQFSVIYPLHLAAKHNHVDCLKVLRQYGFVLDYTTEDGTSLHVAAACGQVDAVRYLLNEGINTDIKNQHGQTVLEMIIDLQENRRPEIAQFVKNPDGWKECRAIIEGMDRRDSGRETEGSQSDNEKEVIWQQIPSQASVQIYPDQRKNKRSIYRPPSISANFRDYSPEETPETDLSVKSDYGYCSQQGGTINRTWNSKMYDQQTGAPRFPITSPYNQMRHNMYSRTSDTLPVRLSGIRTRASPQRGTILPEKSSPYNCAPPQYDDLKMKNRFQSQSPESGAYDNMPNNNMFTVKPMNGSMRTSSIVQMNRSVGYATLPCLPKNSSPRCSRPALTENTFRQETPSSERSLKKNTFSMSRTTCDREDSLGLTHSPRLDTRASSVTSYLTTSTIDQEKFIGENGRAPLALPEEITGSVTGSTLFDSPDKDANVAAIFLGNSKRKPSQPESPPSPNTSKAAIFDKIYNNSLMTTSAINACFPVGIESPQSTLSDVSTASPDSMNASLKIGDDEVRIRHHNRSPNFHYNHRGMLEPNQILHNASMSDSSSEDKKLDSPSDDIDWDKVNRVFNSIGAAPCRESVFVRDFEPRVAVYLRDRSSKALSIQMLDAAVDDLNIEDEKEKIKVPTKLMTVSEWLEFNVCITPSSARDIGAIFEKYGYDKFTQLKGSLTYPVMSEMGIARNHQSLIMNKLEQLEERRPNANSFFYVSDWLNSIELTDYLANFMNAGFKNMTAVKTSEMNELLLNKIGIHLPGHISRIVYSLQRARNEINLRDHPLRTMKELPTARPPRPPHKSQCKECQNNNFDRIKNSLLRGGSVYHAHQLGIHLIQHVNGTDEAHITMRSVKATMKEWDQIPQVTLELTHKGVRVFDQKKQVIHAVHPTRSITIVCQDSNDLNFFCFISSDQENKHHCYTFCVLTSAIALEIIHTFGIMFEVADRVLRNLPIETPLNYCPHQKR